MPTVKVRFPFSGVFFYFTFKLRRKFTKVGNECIFLAVLINGFLLVFLLSRAADLNGLNVRYLGFYKLSFQFGTSYNSNLN